MIDDALNTDKVLARDAIMAHQLLYMNRAEIATFQELLLFDRIVKGNEVLS